MIFANDSSIEIEIWSCLEFDGVFPLKFQLVMLESFLDYVS